MAARQFRIDLDVEGGALAPPRPGPSGSWILDGYATRAGVFRYLEPDGTERLEYRSPEEVEKSAPNLIHCALTNQHPSVGRVTPDNAKEYQQGVVLDAKWEPETQRIRVSCLVTHKDLLDALARGRRELSGGYEVDVEPVGGIAPSGERYTHTQKNIEHNHLAVVDEGRAGPDCALRLDAKGDAVDVVPATSAAAPVVQPPAADPGNSPPPGEGKEPVAMVKIMINGVEHEVPEAVAVAINAERAAMQKKLEEAQAGREAVMEDVKEKTALVAAADAVKAEAKANADAADARAKKLQVKLDAATDELEGLKKQRVDAGSEETINKRVMERTQLQAQVLPVLGNKYEYGAASNDKLRIDALEKVFEGKEASKKRLKGYVDAKDYASVAVLFEHVMGERTDGSPLGGSHAPPAAQETATDPFTAAAQKLMQTQRAKPA